MATLTAIPAVIMQGDSYDLRLSPSDYPASSGWSLSFAIAGPVNLSWTSTASGDAHLLALTAVSTAGLTPGLYSYRIRALNSPKAETYENGKLEVLADLALAVDGALQSLAERMLAICRQAREDILSGQSKSFMIDGRQLQFLSLAEVAKEEAHWRRELAAERRGSSFQKRSVTFVRG